MRLLALLLISCAPTLPVGPAYARGGDQCRVVTQGGCDVELCWPANAPGALRVTGRTCRSVSVPVGPFDEVL